MLYFCFAVSGNLGSHSWLDGLFRSWSSLCCEPLANLPNSQPIVRYTTRVKLAPRMNYSEKEGEGSKIHQDIILASTLNSLRCPSPLEKVFLNKYQHTSFNREREREKTALVVKHRDIKKSGKREIFS